MSERRATRQRRAPARTPPSVSSDALLADLVVELRARGGRLTKPRVAILEALASAQHHVTGEELAGIVKHVQPNVHAATVYRTLDTLEDIGIVYHVHLGHGPAQWHLTAEGHQHLVCERCASVFEVTDEDFAPLQTRLADRFGFRMDPRHFAIYGLCAPCATLADQGRAPSARTPGARR